MTIDLSALEADLNTISEKPLASSSCKVQDLVKEHPEATSIIRTALANKAWSAKAVSRVLTKNGLPIGASSVNLHRKGECTVCKRAAEAPHG